MGEEEWYGQEGHMDTHMYGQIHIELRKGGKRIFANFQAKWTSFWSEI